MQMRIARAETWAIVIITAMLVCSLAAPQAQAGVTVELGNVRAAALDFVQGKFGLSERAARSVMKQYEIMHGSTIIDRLELPEGAVLDFVRVDGKAEPGEPMVRYEGSGILRQSRPQLFYGREMREALLKLPPDQRARLQRNIRLAAQRGFFIQPITAEQRRNLESYRPPGEVLRRPKAAAVIRILVVLNNFPNWDDRSPSPSLYDEEGEDRNHPLAEQGFEGPGGPLSTSNFRPSGLTNPSWSHTGINAATNAGHPRIEYTVSGRPGTSVDLKEWWFDFLFNKSNPNSVTNYYYANSHANISIEGNRSDIVGPLESHHKLDRIPLGGIDSDHAVQPGSPVIRNIPGSGLRGMSADSGTNSIACLYYGSATAPSEVNVWNATTSAWDPLAINSTYYDPYDDRRVVIVTADFAANASLRVNIGGWIPLTPDQGFDLDTDQGAEASLLTEADVMQSDTYNRLCSMCYYTHDHIFSQGTGSRPYQLAHLRNSAGRIDDIGGTDQSASDHADRPKPYDHDVSDHSSPNMGYFEDPESNGGHKYGAWLSDLGNVLADEGIVPTGYSRRINLYPSDAAGAIDAGGTSGPWSGAHVFIPNSAVVLPSDAGLYLTAHELGHTFGMEDLYDLDFYANQYGPVPPLFESSMIGPYSVMAHGGRRVDAWHKIKIGWVTPIAVTSDIVNAPIPEIEGTLENPIIYKLPGRPHYIHDGIPPGQWEEYFLVENRNRTGTDYFGDISPRGLYIYHVDQRFGQTEEWHPKVIIEQADGLYELERNPDGQWGDLEGDPFPGSTDNRFFMQLSDPNSYSHGWKGGTINAPKTEEPPEPPPGVLQPGTSTDSFSRVASISDAGAMMRADVYVVPREVIVTGLKPAAKPDTIPQGTEDVPMLRLHFDNDGTTPNLSMGDVEIDSIKIDENGSSQSDTDVTRVSLWDDTNGNQVLDAAVDTRIASGVFQQQTMVLSGLDYRIPLNEERDIFVTYDINEKAPTSVGLSVGVGLAEFTYIQPEVPGAVQRRVRTAMTASSAGLGSYRFPINSELSLIVEAPDTLTVTPISRAPVLPPAPTAKEINPGDTRVPILSLGLSVDMDSVAVDRLMVDETGTINAVAHVTRTSLYLDADADGEVDPTDQLLAQTTFASVGGTQRATFDISGNSVVVTDASPKSLLLTCSLSVDTPLPSTLQLRLEDPSYVHLVDPLDIVSDENFPMQSDLVSTPEPNFPPAAPENLTAAAQLDGSIALAWLLSDDDPNKAEDDVIEYHIYRATDPADFVGATVYYAVVSAGVTEYVDTNVPLGVDMYYMVRAYDGVQEGPDSNIAGPVRATDGLPPTFSEFDPGKSEEQVARDTTIAFTIEDAGSGVDDTTLAFEVNGVDVAADPATTVTGSAGRKRVEYDPPDDFDYLETVEVRLQVADLSGNVAPGTGQYETYEFTVVGPPTHSVSGLILDGAGQPEAGVTVSAGVLSATTGADGTYEIAGMSAGSYDVVPSKDGRSFSPASRPVTIPPSAVGINFTSGAGYDVSGQVTVAGTGLPLAGVTVSDGQHSDITAADGQWALDDVPAGDYTLTATKAGYEFDPPSIDVAVTSNTSGIDFVASLETFDVSGTIRTTRGERLAGIQVEALTDGAAPAQQGTVAATATTNANGAYTLTGLVAGTYTVRPTDEDYAFEPAERELNLAADESNVDFVAAALYRMTIPAGTNLVGVPIRPLDNDVVAAFGEDASIARWDPANSPPYLTAPSTDPLMSLAPGAGFWVRVADPTTREIAGELVEDTEDIMLMLQPKWNTCANPYARALPWAQLSIPDGSPVSNYGFVYDAAARTYRLVTNTPGLGAVTTVAQNAGFWIRTSSAARVTIEGPGSATASAEKAQVAARRPGPGSWVIPVVARAAGNMDASSYAGVLPEAAENSAAYKIDNPPAVSPYVDVYFTAGAGRRLAVDVRDQAGAVETWDFVVMTDVAGVEVEVSLPDLSEVPNSKKVTLVDVDAGKRLYARTMPAYSYNSGKGGSRHFRLEVGDGVGGGLALAAAAVPAAGGRVAITYTLSAEATVSVQVLNMAGRPVASVATSQPKAAGMSSTVWNGRSKSGAACPAGSYLVQIIAAAADGQQVRALVPAQVQR